MLSHLEEMVQVIAGCGFLSLTGNVSSFYITLREIRDLAAGALGRGLGPQGRLGLSPSEGLTFSPLDRAAACGRLQAGGRGRMPKFTFRECKDMFRCF